MQTLLSVSLLCVRARLCVWASSLRAHFHSWWSQAPLIVMLTSGPFRPFRPWRNRRIWTCLNLKLSCCFFSLFFSFFFHADAALNADAADSWISLKTTQCQTEGPGWWKSTSVALWSSVSRGLAGATNSLLAFIMICLCLVTIVLQQQLNGLKKESKRLHAACKWAQSNCLKTIDEKHSVHHFDLNLWHDFLPAYRRKVSQLLSFTTGISLICLVSFQ